MIDQLDVIRLKHTVSLYGHHNKEIFAWVEECCSKYRCNRNAWTGTHPSVEIESDSEYALFLLRWHDYILPETMKG